MLHLFHFTCNDLCTWLPINVPPLYCLHLETGELLPLPSQRVPQTQLTLFLASAIICSYMHQMHAHVWVHVHCCVTSTRFPPPPPPQFTLSTVSEGTNNPYSKVHSTYQSFLLHLSFSSTRLERRGLDSPTIMAE